MFNARRLLIRDGQRCGANERKSGRAVGRSLTEPL
jgi:hypothetical protein